MRSQVPAGAVAGGGGGDGGVGAWHQEIAEMPPAQCSCLGPTYSLRLPKAALEGRRGASPFIWDRVRPHQCSAAREQVGDDDFCNVRLQD